MKTKSTSSFAILAALFVLVSPIPADAQSGTPGKPEWLTASNQITSDGNFRLTWKAASGGNPEIYRLTENFNGTTGVAYVDGSALDLFRATPGTYTFKLAACVRDQHAVQSCGTESKIHQRHSERRHLCR